MLFWRIWPKALMRKANINANVLNALNDGEKHHRPNMLYNKFFKILINLGEGKTIPIMWLTG